MAAAKLARRHLFNLQALVAFHIAGTGGHGMTAARPAFGKKATSAPQRQARPVRQEPLSPAALAFMEREGLVGVTEALPQDGFWDVKAPADVQTGQPVWTRRVFAYFLDRALVWLFLFAIFRGGPPDLVSTYLETGEGNLTDLSAWAPYISYMIITGIAGSLYLIAMEASSLQATLGKLILGVVVTNRDGTRPSLRTIITRNTLGRVAVNMVPLWGGYLVGLSNPDRRCIHDKVAGTIVRLRTLG